MARKRKLITTLTDDVVERHQSAPIRSCLTCENLTGLHVIRLKSGVSWRYRYRDPAGRRRTVTLGGFPAMKAEQAQQKALDIEGQQADPLAEREAQREAARAALDEAETRNLGAYLDGPYKRLQARKRSGRETLNRIRYNFPDMLHRDMASLTRRDVERWQERREGEGLAHATLQRAYSSLKTMLNHAAKNGVLESNPLANVSLADPIDDDRHQALVERRNAARRLLTADEIRALHNGLELYAEKLRRQRRSSREHGKPDLPDLDAVEYPHWFIPFCYVGLYTGLRPGDLFTLTWQEANITFKRIVKTPAKTRHHREPAQVVMDMAAPLVEVLTRWHEQWGRPETGLLFPSSKTGRAMDKKAHLKPWRHVKKLGGLPDDLAFYALRHHFISTLVAQGVPLLTVARLVGQKSVGMIERHYGHLAPASAASAIESYAASLTA